MSQIVTYLTISIGIILILQLGGIATPATYLLGLVGINTDPTYSWLWLAMSAVMLTAAATGVTATFLGRFPDPYIYLGSFAAATFVIFIGTFASIANVMSNYEPWFYYPTFIIFSVITVGFAFSIFEWVFGRN